MTRRREPCPVVGCLDDKSGGKLMCRAHWRVVPAALRQAVLTTWKTVRASSGSARRAAIRAWRTAADTAICHVTKEDFDAAAS